MFGKGGEVDGGWQMEVRMHKKMFHPDGAEKVRAGHRTGFNIGMDDDDGKGGSGNEGDIDLEIQYFWANGARIPGWNAEEKELGFHNDQELAYGSLEGDDFFEPPVINLRAGSRTGERARSFSGLMPHRRVNGRISCSSPNNSAAPINSGPRSPCLRPVAIT